MMFRRKVAAVSYLNTVPFIYGMELAGEMQAPLMLCPPSRCAEAFRSGDADIALVPVGSLATLSDAGIITSYCIGAKAPVRTVTLMSDVPLEELRRIHLDGHSATSALLVRILCSRYWNIEPEFVQMDDYCVIENHDPHDGFLLIGDKVFDYETRFRHIADLAQCWMEMTSLPMVFAVWIARKGVEPELIAALERSLAYGVDHIAEAIRYYGHSGKPYAHDYLTRNIDFVFDGQKQKALSLFWQEGQKFFPKVNPG